MKLSVSVLCDVCLGLRAVPFPLVSAVRTSQMSVAQDVVEAVICPHVTTLSRVGFNLFVPGALPIEPT